MVSNQVLARIFVSTELTLKLKYSQRLPLTRLCLGSPGKKWIVSIQMEWIFKYNIVIINKKEDKLLVSVSDTPYHNVRRMLSHL